MTDRGIYLYKTPEKFTRLLEKTQLSFRKVDDINALEKVDNAFILTATENFAEQEYFLCRLAVNKDIINIGIYDDDFSENDKEMLYENGVKKFLHKNADFYDIISLIPCEDKKQKPTITGSNKAMLMPDGLINKIAIPIFIKDTDSTFKACNDAFCEYTGKKREQIIGKSSYDFVANKKAQIYEEVDKMVMESGEEREHPGKIILPDNTIHNTIVKKTPLYSPNGEIKGVIGVITDITELKERERNLKKEKNKAKTSDKLKTSFLSNMSHEIRTPMNAIVGFSQLLTTPELPEDKKEVYVNQINYNAEQLLKLIEDIIEVSKIEAGKVKVDKSECYVNQLLDELHTSFTAHKGILGKHNVKLKISKDVRDRDFVVFTDRYRLNQILSNLLGNALKFTDKGFIEFGYNKDKDEGKDVLEFYVKDTGLGINKDKLPYIFDRFSKIPASKTKLYGGTGIGLSISKSLVELLGGRIYVESEENKGTAFYFTVPFEKREGGNKTKSENENNEYGVVRRYNWADKKILVAEDEEMNFLYLNEVLKATKAKIVWMQNGKLAVEEFKAKPHEYDLVLMDIKMPKMDGYEATKAIKEIDKNTPVIVQTAYAMKSEREKGFAAGCNEYLEKPVKQDLLFQLIEKYFTL